MKNNEIIVKIGAEIERQNNLSNEKRGQARRTKDYYNEVAYGAEMDVCNRLLSFLSDLETKVADSDGLNGEIERYFEGWSDDSEYGQAVMRDGACAGVDECEDIARHFYDLGCRRTAEKYDESEKPMNQAELEKEIEEYLPESTFNTGFNYDDLQEIARHFAEWGAEHLKKMA
jgi:hypothetical protein